MLSGIDPLLTGDLLAALDAFLLPVLDPALGSAQQTSQQPSHAKEHHRA